MVCTLTVELKASVQSTLMAFTQLNGEWTWEVWSESVTSKSSTGLKTKIQAHLSTEWQASLSTFQIQHQKTKGIFVTKTNHWVTRQLTRKCTV